MNKVLIALLSGVAIGILIAPDKGSRTREKLTDGFNDLADKLSGLKERFSPEQDSVNAQQSFTSPSMSSQF